MVALKDLRPWKGNPRENEDAVPKLMMLIEQHGFKGIIAATPDGTIRAGHTRYEALKKLGWEEAPVEWVNFPSENAAEEYSLSDNRASEFSNWDKDRLTKLFKKRKSIDVAALSTRTGFTRNSIKLAIDPGERDGRPEKKDFAAVEKAYRGDPRGFCRFVFSLLDVNPKSKPEFVDETVTRVWAQWSGNPKTKKPVRPKRPRTSRGH